MKLAEVKQTFDHVIGIAFARLCQNSEEHPDTVERDVDRIVVIVKVFYEGVETYTTCRVTSRPVFTYRRDPPPKRTPWWRQLV